jgi:hypothetical protein
MVANGISVIETSVLWAAWSFMQQGCDVDVPDEFTSARPLFINFLHNLLLFEHLRTDLDVAGEEDWYAQGVRSLIDELRGVVSVGGMPPIEQGGDRFLENKFAPEFKAYVEKSVTGGKKKSLFDLPWFYYKRGLRTGSSDEMVYRVLQETIDQAPLVRGFDPEERFFLAANGAFLFRGLRYAGHANSVWKNETRAAVYSASPGRIAALASFLNSPTIGNVPFLQTNYLDLIEGLSLPKTGYDWDFLPERLRPIKQKTLREMLASLEPRKALEKVLSIRESADGKRIREIWASRLWNRGQSCIEGGQHIVNSNVHGSVVQIAISKEAYGHQHINSSSIDREITQYASRKSIQSVDGSEADALTQMIETRLSAGA